MFSFNEIVEIAIKLENNSENTYRKAKEILNRKDLDPFFDWIMIEENEHAQYFSSLKEKVESGEEGLIKELTEALVSDYLGDQSFSLKEVDFDAIDKPADLFGVFIEFEKDTIIFYEMLKNFVSESSINNKIDIIINEENNHISKMIELKKYL